MFKTYFNKYASDVRDTPNLSSMFSKSCASCRVDECVKAVRSFCYRLVVIYQKCNPCQQTDAFASLDLQKVIFENIVAKGEIAHDEQFPHLPQYYKLNSIIILSFI